MPQSQEVVEGEKAEFVCSVSKDTFIVKWMKDDKELEKGDKYDIVCDGKRRILVIKNSEPKDEGAYVALIGTTRATADLFVLGMSSICLFSFLFQPLQCVCVQYMCLSVVVAIKYIFC